MRRVKSGCSLKKKKKKNDDKSRPGGGENKVGCDRFERLGGDMT